MQKRTKTPQFTVQSIVLIALLMAIEIILTRFLSITTPFVRISFGFLPIALIAILYGPLQAALAYAVGDFLGAILIPSGTGVYFPGFTLTAFLIGLTYGLLLHGKPVTWKRVLPASAIVCLIFNLGLDSLWIHIMLKEGLWAYMPARITRAFVMLPIQTLIIPLVYNRVVSRFVPAVRRSA